ncbi:MAG: carboxylating nicotinate-nucleotide diphosphorylase [Candidatus Schekmanbacteria bacterium]|nr:carboxylating nicotinate-nucleotide diphosphorylase [Candidatus Schekmanbacteria bacterium]
MCKNCIIDLALVEDIGSGDITTAAIVPDDLILKAELQAKEDLVLAGLGVVKQVFEHFDPQITLESLHTDGNTVYKGEVIARITGKANAILTGERTALNFLQHLSGIASATSLYVKLLEPYKAKLIDTRKTTPGMRTFEKYAVRCGGGQNHRLGLFGGIMIKDNHIAAAGSITEAAKRARKNAPPVLKIEVETTTLEEVKEAIAVEADIIMLDNMDVETIAQAVKLINGQAMTEASGDVNLSNIEAVAQTGVDYISVGRITHSAKSVDISLEVVPS